MYNRVCLSGVAAVVAVKNMQQLLKETLKTHIFPFYDLICIRECVCVCLLPWHSWQTLDCSGTLSPAEREKERESSR